MKLEEIVERFGEPETWVKDYRVINLLSGKEVNLNPVKPVKTKPLAVSDPLIIDLIRTSKKSVRETAVEFGVSVFVVQCIRGRMGAYSDV